MNALLINAQQEDLEKANTKYEQLDYIDAIDSYLKIVATGYRSEILFTRLGNAYYFNSNYREASKWYHELYLLKKKDINSKLLLRYSQSLNAIDKRKESIDVYNQFLEKSLNKNANFLSANDYLNIIEENTNRYKITPLSINSKGIDFGAYSRENTFYFASTRNNKNVNRHIDSWSNLSFLDIYTSDFNTEIGDYQQPKLIKGDVNTKYHESTPVITKDGKTMYFTRSNNTSKIKKNEHIKLKIYRATKIGDKWTNVEDLSINSDTFSNAHPVLSLDGEKLYFVSNMPSSFGQTDIFYVDILKNGNLGKPQNLGSKVNTEGRESFPYITNNNELYFSSDGHFGLGGYDVFYINLFSKEKQLINVGKPINSSFDDYAFSINNITKKGFFSSNRDATDNIYSFLETQSIKELVETEIKGLVIDKDTKVPLKNSLVTIIDNLTEENIILKTNAKGEFLTAVNRIKSYKIEVSKNLYSKEVQEVAKKQSNVYLHFKLSRVIPITKQGIDLALALEINKVYFDFDSSYLNKEAKDHLKKLLLFLNNHPKITITISAHTDSRGTEKYNIWLSRKRANRIKEYLIKEGVDHKRLSTVSNGELYLLNKCKKDITCSKLEHKLNRRTEFIINKYNK